MINIGKFIDRTNMRYGKLICKEYLGNSKWLCECDCGNKSHIVSSRDLSNGHTKSCGCLNKKYNIDEHYFDNIDTEEKAYILGLICADGNVTIKPYNAKIDLKYDDIDILEKIKIAMNYNYDIRTYEQKCRYKNSTNPYISKTVRLNITNKVIVEKLITYNIVPNKSNILDFKFDIIPNKLLRHFIRGLWDGDGSIVISNDLRKSTINLTSSITMLNKIKDIFIQQFPNTKIYIYNRHKENPQNGTMIISNNQDMFNILNYIYKDSNIYLDRKYNKYQKLISLFKNSNDYPIRE